MAEHWIDPRDAEFLAELKRLKKEGREAQISKDKSQWSVTLGSGKFKVSKNLDDADRVIIIRKGRFPWSRDRRVSNLRPDKDEDK
jgi:hypothetical protein